MAQVSQASTDQSLRYAQRFEKEAGSENSRPSPNSDLQIPFIEDGASSSFEGCDHIGMGLPLPAPLQTLAAGDSFERLSYTFIPDSRNAQMQNRLISPQADRSSGEMYPGTSLTMPGALASQNVLGQAASPLGRMTPLETEALFRNLCIPPLPGQFEVTNSNSADSPAADSDSLTSASSTSGFPTPVCLPVSPTSTTGASVSGWAQPANLQPLDQMIWQMASYRVHTWESSGQ